MISIAYLVDLKVNQFYFFNELYLTFLAVSTFSNFRSRLSAL
jgi:hypothetical protein